MQQLVKEFRETKKYSELRENRRPQTHLYEEQKSDIDKAYEDTLLTSRMLYYELKRRNRYAPKNKLYVYMKIKDWVRNEPNKQKKKKALQV